ncbi:hypothetical protein AGABI1DRAFT_118424 [Agaricus bisporus var. burnettii JB137-S8]|uniref:DNA-directed DNA polymerase n=1 Tax=Agaricus bisporus var. burnettii (strain JB137-S8 / ATCC MYA-4627 / FGSC 10392) TaxID=597362 RepID=K5Y4P7_AGABU|nr:uncharacterized protein AGABI1DRAFT_118424 [Agaricus bisporus var. burnettii JB137-S8]EKM83025.1 hypothetical protein AGABI1DRAFT_118424 [Agaricus bisporus var. burnettii JB137-S8]
MSTTLALFWHLSSADKKERLNASVKLVSALEQFQAQFVPQPQSQINSDDEEDQEEAGQNQKQKEDTLDALNAQDVSYSIRRLVRGLASPRESSRLGFAVALTELLSRIDTVTCAQVVKLVMDNSKTQGSMTGQEERDVLFARLFGLMSVIQSGLVVRTGSLNVSASSSSQISTLSSYTDVLAELVIIGEKKSWLRESAWFAVLLGVDVLHEANVEWKEEAVDATIRQIFVEYKIWSPEKIALALKMQSLFPEENWSAHFAPTFKNGDILSSTNLPMLARILKESAVEDSEESTKSGGVFWKPQLHFVWRYLLDQYLPGPNSGNLPRGSFQEFFLIAVDESLFSTTASPQRKHWGFQVFQKALSRIDEEHMPMLFSKNFMRSWINHLSNRDGYLHKIAQQTATEVQAFVKSNPHLGFSLILQLTGSHGSQNFDKLTKTKTLGSIVSSLDSEGIQKYIQWLFSQVDDIEASDERQWTIEQLSALIRNNNIPKSDEWIQSVLDYLVVHGLFLVNKKSSKNPVSAARSVAKPPFSDELQNLCRKHVLSCVSDLNNQISLVQSGNTAEKISAVASDGDFWVSRVLKTIALLEKDSKHLSILIEAGDEDRQLRQQAQELAERLKAVDGSEKETARGARLLLLATTLQHYCVDEPEDIDGESLEKKKKARNDTDASDETDEPVDMLVDTIIGFLEKSTAYLKTTANKVFALLSGSVKESTVDLILTQLERRPVGHHDKEEDVEMNGTSDEDEDGETESEDSEEDSEDEESDEDDEDEDEDDEEALALRNKLEQALRVNGIEPATGETDSEDEELMDDDQMLAIDDQLVGIIRPVNRDAQRQATHFKNRVLDLVDTYIKRQPSNVLILRFITPLVDLITTTGADELQLSDKTRGILCNKLVPHLKELPSDIPKEAAVKAFVDTHTKARQIRVHGLSTAFKQISFHLTRILLSQEGEDVILENYRASLVDFFTRKNSALHPDFFEGFLRQYRSVGWKLREDILELSSKALNGHRKSQAFQFLLSLIPVVSTEPDRKAEWTAFLPSFISSLHATLSAACGGETSLSSVQFKAVLKVAADTQRLTQRLAPEELVLWEVDSWISLENKLVNCQRLKSATGLRQMCKQLIGAIQKFKSEQPTKQKKRKVTDTQPVSEKRETKRKKVKGSV